MIHCHCETAEAVILGQPGFFNVSDRYEALSETDDPLERLALVVDFEVFRRLLVAAHSRSVSGKGGRPPFDPVLMFKILVLQALYSLSEDDRVPNQGSSGFPAVPGPWARGNGASRDDGVAVPRAPGQGEGDRPAVRSVRCGAHRPGLSGSGWADHRCHGRARAGATEYRSGEGGDQGGSYSRGLAVKPAKLRQKDRDARWSVNYTKATLKKGADSKAFRPVDLAISMLGKI